MTSKQLYAKLNAVIPPELSCDWDNDGLMVYTSEKEIKKVLVALDITLGAIEHAVMNGYDCIVSHHPLIFRPLTSVTLDSNIERRVIYLIKNGIDAMSFHTRLDAVSGGVNNVLAERLGLINVKTLSGLGTVGTLPEEMPLREFSLYVKDMLGCDSVKYSDGGKQVRTVAAVGGSGDEFIKDAINAGADTFVTGEGHHNTFADASESGINYVVAGHFETEDPVCKRLITLVKEADASLEVGYYCSRPSLCV